MVEHGQSVTAAAPNLQDFKDLHRAPSEDQQHIRKVVLMFWLIGACIPAEGGSVSFFYIEVQLSSVLLSVPATERGPWNIKPLPPDGVLALIHSIEFMP